MKTSKIRRCIHRKRIVLVSTTSQVLVSKPLTVLSWRCRREQIWRNSCWQSKTNYWLLDQSTRPTLAEPSCQNLRAHRVDRLVRLPLGDHGSAAFVELSSFLKWIPGQHELWFIIKSFLKFQLKTIPCFQIFVFGSNISTVSIDSCTAADAKPPIK